MSIFTRSHCSELIAFAPQDDHTAIPTKHVSGLLPAFL